MTPPFHEATLPEIAEETLRLHCPGCGGALNLKRKHLGVTGKCVHCDASITALAENGQVRVISGTPALANVEESNPRPLAEELLAPKSTELNPSMWDFPQWEADAPSSEASGFITALRNDFSFPISNSDTGDLIADRNEVPVVAPPTRQREEALFGTTAPFQAPVSSMFKNEDESIEINPAWGTKVPQEIHASISPFATGSAGGGGFAETLFREKVVKDSAGVRALFAPPVSKNAEKPAGESPTDVSEKRDILDGDGRSIVPKTREEESDFGKRLFATEKSLHTPRWMKRAMRSLFTISAIGLVGTGIYFLTPEEKLAQWKEKAYVWLEPGLAILDYLPEGMRPDWLPRTNLGIEAGADENGVPKAKLNAFEGLKDLDTDQGDTRGASEDELKNLNKF